MAIGSVNAQPLTQVAPASMVAPVSVAPLSMDQQYRDNQLRRDLVGLREANSAGDADTVNVFQDKIKRELPNTALSPAEKSQMLQVITNPTTAGIKGAEDFMVAYTDENSFIKAANRQTYTSDSLGSLNAPAPTPDLGAAGFGGPPPYGGSQLAPSPAAQFSPQQAPAYAQQPNSPFAGPGPTN